MTTHTVFRVPKLLEAGLFLVAVLGLSTVSARGQACGQTFPGYFAFADANGWTRPGPNGSTVYADGFGPGEDADNDGLTNAQEFQGWQTVVNGIPEGYSWQTGMDLTDCGPSVIQPDTDFDGLGDRGEFLAGTNPRNPDTDGDGLGDAPEVYLGLTATDDGTINPDNAALADPDGDGLTNAEEIAGPDGRVPVIPAATAGNRNGWPALGADDYTLPLHADSDGDSLLDSYEYQLWLVPLDPSDGSDNAFADPDGDGLTTFREQILHPLLNQFWRDEQPDLYPLPLPSIVPVTIEAGIYGGFGRAMLNRSGYLNLVQFDDPDLDFWPDSVGSVLWGHPVPITYERVVMAPYVTTNGVVVTPALRWTDYSFSDTDNDLIPDGFEVEHGLNPLSGLVSAEGALEPSGGLGDPDEDTLLNYEEYWGQDGYRVSIVTGTGDESNPWISRIINRAYEMPFGISIGHPNWTESAHRFYQSPLGYLGIYNSTFSTSFDPNQSFSPVIGFFEPTWLPEYRPVPGVPPALHLDDFSDGLPDVFAPFGVSRAGYLFDDTTSGDGIFTPGDDDAWLDVDLDGAYTPFVDIVIVDLDASLLGGEAGLPITVNVPLKWPMPGRDTDDDGVPDHLEVQADIAQGKEPSSVVFSSDPFLPKSAKILSNDGMPLLTDPDANGRYYFNRDWTIECWVYMKDEGPGEYTGSFILGEVVVTTLTRTGYEIGVDADVPYVRFETLGGKVYRVDSPNPLDKDTWIHLAGVFDHKENRLSLFIDGLLDQSEQVLEESSSSFGPGRGGRVLLAVDGGGSKDFAGSLWLDEVRIWGIPRSDDLIADDRDNTVNPFQLSPTPQYPAPLENALFAYFTFDDGGKTAQDLTKRAMVSLLGYDYPSDEGLTAALELETFYGDTAYCIDSEAIRGPGERFAFDANNTAPVIGEVDAERGAFDSDGDGLPDGWELRHELNPLKKQTPDHIQGPQLDPNWGVAEGPEPDATRDMETPNPDGLDNINEYYARTNPRKNDTDEDAVPDPSEDFDQDGLANITEVEIRSRPDLADTDDDESPDSQEQADATIAVADTSPPKLRAVYFDGYVGSRLKVPLRSDFRLESWTLEARVLPAADHVLADGQGEIVVRRSVQDTENQVLASNFDLRLVRLGTNLTVEARFVYVDATTGEGIIIRAQGDPVTEPRSIVATETTPEPTGRERFTPVAASYDWNTGALRAYVDGIEVARTLRPEVRAPLTGEGPRSFMAIGEGYRGFIDDVRIWSVQRSQEDIIADKDLSLTGNEEGLVSYFRIDDGGWPSIKMLAPVLDQISTPTGLVSIEDADRFIVDSPATDEFLGQEGNIAQYRGRRDEWLFLVPADGERVYDQASGMVYQYAAAGPPYWVAVSSLPTADPVAIPSVRFASPPAPGTEREGDTWLDAGNIHTFESGTAFAASTPPTRVFSQGAMVLGAANDGDYGWHVSRDQYYRRDTSLAAGVPAASPGFVRWGPGFRWLGDALVRVETSGSELTLLGLSPFVGDQYLKTSPAPVEVWTWNGVSFDAAEILDEQRVLVVDSGEVVDYDEASGTLYTVADATTEGGGLYLYVKADGTSYRSDGVSLWKRWGYIPTLANFTQTQGWLEQWSEAATIAGGTSFYTLGADLSFAAGDSDGDGMPDDWEIDHDLDPFDPTGDNGADGDPDGDGLTNIYEYWSDLIGDYDPQNPDTDSNGISDYDEDADGDGVSNGNEQDLYGTMPHFPDTDDDGLTDGEEVRMVYEPTNSLIPRIDRALLLDGSPDTFVTIPNDLSPIGNTNRFRLALQSWEVEAWVNPWSATNEMSVIVERSFTEDRTNFLLAMDTNRQVVLKFTPADGSADVQLIAPNTTALPLNGWTHTRGIYSFADRTIALFINGELVASQVTEKEPMITAPSDVLCAVGRSFHGYIDEVSIQTPRPGSTAPDVVNPLGLSFRTGFVVPDSGIDPALSALPQNQPVTAVAQFHIQSDDAVTTLAAEGLEVMYRLSDRAYVVRGEPRDIETVPGLRYAGLVPAPAKVSPHVTPNPVQSGRWLLAEFFRNTPEADAAAAVTASGAHMRSGGYDADGFMLIEANDAQLAALTQSDLLAYVRPSAPHMFQAPLMPYRCMESVDGIDLAPFAVVGVGWDGPGLGSASLTYYFINGTPDLSGEETVLEEAMAKWAAVVPLTFTRTSVPNLLDSIDVGYFSGSHGDGAPFDGPLGVLAHAFLPKDVNAEPIAGDLHFDEAEDWVAAPSGGIDLRQVALHELGHSLGMDHSDDPDAIMYPFYQSGMEPVELRDDDIEGIQTLYGGEEAPGGPVPPGTVLLAYHFDDFTNPDGTSGRDELLTGQVEDFSGLFPANWLRVWANAGTLEGNAVVVPVPPDAPVQEGQVDADEDGIPDWWELQFFPDLDAAGSPGDVDGYTDSDGDGLNDYYEYLSGNSPLDQDSDNDGVLDGQEDPDGDGLSNIDEQRSRTNPVNSDTDDDGVADGVELGTTPPTNPRYSMSQVPATVNREGFLRRSLDLGALASPGSGVFPPHTNLHDRRGADWTIELRYRPGISADGDLLAYELTNGRYQYGLSVVAGVPRLTVSDLAAVDRVVSASGALTPGVWHHLAASWNAETRELSLYVDGMIFSRVLGGLEIAGGHGQLVLGRGLTDGHLDEVRLWTRALAIEEWPAIEANFAQRNDTDLSAYFRFDDGGASAEDFAHRGNMSFAIQGIGSAMVTSPAALIFGTHHTPADDLDQDGLSDWFEDLFGLPVGDADADANDVSDAEEDLDGDGLNNRYEMYTGLDPTRVSTFADGISDHERDSLDGDGVINVDEQRFGSSPWFADTDDDTVTDASEIAAGTNPANAGNPDPFGGLTLNGSQYVDLPRSLRHAVEDWTVAAWVRPGGAMVGNATAIKRSLDGGGASVVTYELGLNRDGASPGVPYIRFTAGEGAREYYVDAVARPDQAIPVAADGASWTHIAGRFRPDTRTLFLYVNGRVNASLRVAVGDAPDLGGPAASERIGDGFIGMVTEVQVASGLNHEEVYRLYDPSARRSAVVRASDVMLLIDRSGSMLTDNRMQDAKDAAKLLVDTLPDDMWIAVIDFDDMTTLTQDFTQDKQLLKDAIDTLEARGGTSYLPAVDLAADTFDAFGSPRQRRCVFLSDGVPSDPPDAAKIQEWADRGLVIDTIGYGSSFGFFGDILEDMAEGTGGRFFEAPTAEQLRDAFADIAASVSAVGYPNPPVISRYNFNDGGVSAENASSPNDWFNSQVAGAWAHAGVPVGYGVPGSWRVKLTNGQGPVFLWQPRYDQDRDGIAHDDEVLLGSRLDLVDSDDDAVLDALEVAEGSHPGFSMSKTNEFHLAGNLALDLGGGALAIPAPQRFDLESANPSWMVEAWFLAADADESGSFISYSIDAYKAFEIGVVNSLPYVTLHDVNGSEYRVTADAPVPAGEWVHIAGAWDASAGAMQLLYTYGLNVVRQEEVLDGVVPTVMGSEFAVRAATLGSATFAAGSLLDEVRVWSVAPTQDELLANRDVLVQANHPALRAYYRFDDGGDSIEDFAWKLFHRPGRAYNVRSNPEGEEISYDGYRYVLEPATSVVDPVVRSPLRSGVNGTDSDDVDEDGMADWFEDLYYYSVTAAAARGDEDHDSLLNEYEYRSFTDPWSPDRDHDGVLDIDEDRDADGLSNRLEQDFGSRPDLPDTDDDGLLDGEEVTAPSTTVPVASRSPMVARALSLDGAGSVRLPVQQRLLLPESWTVEAWARLATGSDGGVILSRRVGDGVNYELGVDASLAPYARYVGVDESLTYEMRATSPVPLQRTNAWYHVAAVHNINAETLTLYVNGVLAAREYTAAAPAIFPTSGHIVTAIGEDFEGLIDDVRIWNLARGTEDIAGSDLTPFDHSEAGLVVNYRFDDGTRFGGGEGTSGIADWEHGQVEDFAVVAGDWKTNWRSAGTLVGSAAVVTAATPMRALDFVDTDDDDLPDWWEIAYYGTIAAVGPTDDTDGDGLNALYEFRSGTNPLVGDTFRDGLSDLERDGDLDGLSNGTEQALGTHPDQADTDDDGLSDWEEVTGQDDVSTVVVAGGRSDARNALDPAKQRSVCLDGNGRVLLPSQDRFAVSPWTIQAWVWPSNNVDGIVVRSAGNDLAPGVRAVNYELGVTDDAGVLRVYARFTAISNGVPVEFRVDGTTTNEVQGGSLATAVIPVGEWSHLAAVYDSEASELKLYVEGALAAYRTDVVWTPTVGAGVGLAIGAENTVGGGSIVDGIVEQGFQGCIDEVKIYGGAAAAEDILADATGVSPISAAVKHGGSSVPAGVVQLSPAEALSHPHTPGQLMVRFRDNVVPAVAEQTLIAAGVTVLKKFGLVPVYVVEVPEPATLAQTMADLMDVAEVSYVEPNYRVYANRTPNDPQYGDLWGLNNTGQTGGTADADIDAPEAWDRVTGSEDVIVAVIDTGVDYTHPDLAGNMWINPGETPANGVDDDGNGYIDDVYGYDFYNDDSDPIGDEGFHGTHVAGTIGALGDNAQGVAGVNWRVKIMACKFLGPFGGSLDDAIEALEYATSMGAHLSNNSWGGGGYSQALYDAIKAAGDANRLFVAAAGNEGLDSDQIPAYPGAYDLDNIISVAATDHNDLLAGFSNYGAESVDLAGPGVDILSTFPNGAYDTISGTSMASPHVAGVAALILANTPGLSYGTVKSLILRSADRLDNLEGWMVTGARLNAAGAVRGGAAGLVAYYTFDDDTSRSPGLADDATAANDFETGFRNAGILQQGVVFSQDLFLDATRLDSDEDGLPDWWEVGVGLNPLDATGDNGAGGDPDGDGLTNASEYAAGTDPWQADSDLDGTPDYFEDSDGDGLANGQEQDVTGTDLGLADTDDDGVDDGAELAGATDPMDAHSPVLDRAAYFNGQGRLRVRNEDAGDRVPDSWMVEAWVKPDATNASGIILRRAEYAPEDAGRWIDYELGLDNGVPYVLYAFRQDEQIITQRVDAPSAITTNWTHVAGVADRDQSQLRLMVDGFPVNWLLPAEVPPAGSQGYFETLMGGGDMVAGVVQDGLAGALDAVRVWRFARDGFVIQQDMGERFPEFTTDGEPDALRSPTRIFNFDDGGSYLQNSRYPREWSLDWPHAAQAEGPTGSVTLVAAAFPPLNLDSDDDGISDVDERASNWLELRSESPFVDRYLAYDGTGEVLFQELIDGVETHQYAVSNWTVEAWVRLAELPPTDVSVVSRQTRDGDRKTFEVGLTPQGYPYAMFSREDAGDLPFRIESGNAVPVGTNETDWVHLAATYGDDTFVLYMNGVEMIRGTDTLARPVVDLPGYVNVGEPGLVGDVTEARVWTVARSAIEVRADYDRKLIFSAGSLLRSYDGGAAAANYLGRPTDPEEDGIMLDQTEEIDYFTTTVTIGRIVAPFTAEAWVKMEPGAAGGTILERKSPVGVGVGEQAYATSYIFGITGAGEPFARWSGGVQIITPRFNDTGNFVGIGITIEPRSSEVRSEVNIRDGQWHHLAAVGDGNNVKLYIDGIFDVESLAYYLFRGQPDPSWEALYFMNAPSDSVLRIADDGLDALVDEVLCWNLALDLSDIQRHMTYGLTKSDVRNDRRFIDPLPEDAIDDGEDHFFLVSYMRFDGQVDPPFIRDEANSELQYRMLPQPVGGALVDDNSPVEVDPLRGYEQAMVGYFAINDGGQTVENYMERLDGGFVGQLSGGVRFMDFNAADPSPILPDTDGDGLPDWWETLHGLDPANAAGNDGPWGDGDGDGLDNRDEYLAGTDPNDWDSDGDGFGDFDSRNGPGDFTFGEAYDDGDGMPNAWEVGYPAALSPLLYDAHLDWDFDGWRNRSEFMADSNPTAWGSTPTPAVVIDVDYFGNLDGDTLRVHAFSNAAMNGLPDAVGRVLEPVFPLTGAQPIWTGALREGDNWFFAWLDLDDNGTWDEGEPAAIPWKQPHNVGWDRVDHIEFTLTDDSPYGTFRFSWDTPAEANSPTVTITRITTAGAPVVFQKVMDYRTFIHEGDYPVGGLANGGTLNPGYEYFVEGGGGLFNFHWNGSHPSPTPISPVGGEVVHARNEFIFDTAEQTTEVKLEVHQPGISSALYSEWLPVPDRKDDGTYHLPWPFYAGDELPGGGGVLTNGIYTWRVAARDPAGSSSNSAKTPFTVNLQDAVAGASTIGGEVFYFGKAAVSPLLVQAYVDRGFSLEPHAQVTLDDKGPFKLRGLRPGIYYVRAFIDSNGNRRWDDFETFGFIKNPEFYLGDYLPRALNASANLLHQRLILRDQDTDNDNIPDAWEYQFMGDLDTAGPGSDTDSDGLTDLREYQISLLDTDPTEPDTDGDGLTDYEEVFWNGSGDYDPYHVWMYPFGTDLDPHNPDTDGDGLTDGDEVLIHGTDPLVADSDGDGAGDGIEVGAGSAGYMADTDGDQHGDALEIVLGSNPGDASSVPPVSDLLQMLSASASSPTDNLVTYDFAPGVTGTYERILVTVEYSTNLLSGFRKVQECETSIAPADWSLGPWGCSAPHDTNTLWFYRTRWRISD